ncbi:MAG: MaoC family dehydratase [Candidatus Methylomirabilales bacterium]
MAGKEGMGSAKKAPESLKAPSQVNSFGLEPGDHVEVSKTITDAEIEAFSSLSGDDNPLHMDEAFAQKTRFHGRIGQGILTASLISTALTRLTKGLFVYTSQDLQFTGPVHPGDTIKATAQVAEILDRGKVRFRTVCLNQRGETVLEGFAEMKRLKEASL